MEPARNLSLLRGNKNNRVSVRIGDETVCTIRRPVAKQFSRTWRRELADIHCNTVSVAMSSPNAMAAPAGNVPAATQTNPTPTFADKNAVMFIVQWMERGGADPTGKRPLLYPIGNLRGLKKLRDLATALEVDHLIARTKRDLGAIPRPKFCTLC